ncbi:MAG: hypothetical protein DRJ97_04325 [Thermoprotei archaeon]|nr:MAG: hypothetical protein DRJ97_04325 [Thermoprotei archaeon]
MFIVVAGLGGVGEATVRRMLLHGYKVSAIDVNPDVTERLARLLEADVNLVTGSATDPHVLIEAGVKKADVFAALTGSDSVNLIASLLAKNLGAKRVLVRVKHPSYMEVCRSLGLTELVNHVESSVARLYAMVRRISLFEILEIARRDVEVEEVVVAKGSWLEGFNPTKIHERDKDAYPLLILSRQGPLLPNEATRLEAGDALVLLRRRHRLHVPGL